MIKGACYGNHQSFRIMKSEVRMGCGEEGPAVRILQVMLLGEAAQSWIRRCDPDLGAAAPDAWQRCVGQLGLMPATWLSNWLNPVGVTVDVLAVDDPSNRDAWSRQLGMDAVVGALIGPLVAAVARAQRPDVLAIDRDLVPLLGGQLSDAAKLVLAVTPGAADGLLPAPVALQLAIGGHYGASILGAIGTPHVAVLASAPDALFPGGVAPSPDRPRTVDVVCATTAGPATPRTIKVLSALAKAPMGLRGEFELRLHLDSPDRDGLPIGLVMNDHGPAHGAALAAAAAGAKIVVDLADGRSDAVRLNSIVICAAAGATLVAEDGAVPRNLLTPGRDGATFASPEALLDAVYWLLGNPELRLAMAQRAQAKFLAGDSTAGAWTSVKAALDLALTAGLGAGPVIIRNPLP
ncbi:MAG: glycosyltransferase [Rhodospirillaceae bacterium]|nr:glycosyltransferase [Rhodospirillaceae bacterium]